MDNPVSLTLPTREVFGNIEPWMQVVFYVLMTVSFGVLVWRIWQRVRLWRQGVAGDFERDWRLWCQRIMVYVVGQKRVHRRTLGAALHLLLFSGFVVLTIGTTLLAISHLGPMDFHHGLYYLFYELTMDVFGVAFCLGCLLAVTRRLWRKPENLSAKPGDLPFLALLLLLGITGFVLEALRLHYTNVPTEVARWSIVGWGIQLWLFDGVGVELTRTIHLWMWWTHVILIALFFAVLPSSRMLHAMTAPVHIAIRPTRRMGVLEPLPIEEVERTGRTGAGSIEHFNRRQLLSLDACMECGRCAEVCPAKASGKPLSPMAVVVDLRNTMESEKKNHTPLGGVSEESLWACTNCQACVQECPVLIDHVDLINDMRRFLIGEGQFSGPAANALKHAGAQFNPYGRPHNERFDWAEGLNVPTVESNPDFEYLFWVGCAASFDPRAQKVARAVVELLKTAGINFAVLGKQERCTGDPARRMGDEFLFQDLAQQNIRTLDTYRTKQIVTACPHCFNTLQNEYPQFKGNYEVLHHSQLLAKLLESGKLAPMSNSTSSVTLHDPCFLARANDEIDAPRNVLRKGGCSDLHEMPRRGKKTFCCGAGGRSYVV